MASVKIGGTRYIAISIEDLALFISFSATSKYLLEGMFSASTWRAYKLRQNNKRIINRQALRFIFLRVIPVYTFVSGDDGGGVSYLPIIFFATR